jgi:hypothetical protein
VIPLINSVNSNEGSTEGNELVITGNTFGVYKENINI